MKGYYYILPSLPFLSIDGEAPFSSEVFLQKISGFVPDKDFESIRRLLFDEPVDCKEAREYLSRKKTIDSLLLSKRERKLFGRNIRYSEPADADGQDVMLAEKAFADANPLSAERSLLELYWNCAERMGFMHGFDFTSLCVYAIKLKLLSRMRHFDRKRGSEEFDRIFSSLRVAHDDSDAAKER